MRLVCPNCDAQYEVVDDVIPAEGRDVQCSNCGHTWFQHHPDHTPAEEDVTASPLPEDLAEPDDAPTEDEERVEASPPPPPDLEETPDALPEPAEMDSATATEAAEPHDPPPVDEPQSQVAPDVADILREEAERETAARASETLETQPDLGLDAAETDSERRARQARERMARLRGEEPDPIEAAVTAAAIESRKELLPDIEEINSTLRSEADREAGPAAPSPEAPPVGARRGGFRSGFLLTIILAVIAVAIYAFAPQIAAAVPQADPYLSAYVAQVDQGRMWLDGRVTAALTWLDNAAAQSE